MIRRLFYRPLYILFTEDHWMFCDDKPRLRHSIKILMTVPQLDKYNQKFHPGFYEVKMQRIGLRPVMVFAPLRQA